MSEACEADASVDQIRSNGPNSSISFDVSLSPCDDSHGTVEFAVHLSRAGQAIPALAQSATWRFRGEQTGTIEHKLSIGPGETITSVEVTAVHCACD